MSNRTSNIILIGMLLGAVLGVICGFYFGSFIIHLKFLGTIFLNLLKMIVVPLIVASIIVGVTSLGDIRKLGRTAGKTMIYYMATTAIAVLIGLILVNLLKPGIGVVMGGGGLPEIVADSSQKTIVDVFVSLFPSNIFSAAVQNQILPLILFSLVVGGILMSLGQKGKPLVALFETINAVMMKLVMLVIYFAPVGVFALIAGIVAENRASIDQLVSGLGMFALTVIIGLLIQAVVVLPIALKIFGRRNPVQYFLNMGQAIATAFTTDSSSATLPVTMKCVQDKNEVDRKASSFVLPLGATINMDGTALYEAVAAMFFAQMYGVDLGVGDQLIIFLTAILASIGAAGIPHAGMVTMVFVLTAVGLPLEGIGLILAIDWLLDRCRTVVNVWGDSVGAVVISETAEMKRYLVPSRKKTESSSRKPRTTRGKFDKPVSKSSDKRGSLKRKDSFKATKSSSDRPKRVIKAKKTDVTTGRKPAPMKPKKVVTSKIDQPIKSKPVLNANNVSNSKPKPVEKNEIKKERAPIKKAIADKKTPAVGGATKVDDKKNDDFFSAEFSKMNLFADSSESAEKKTAQDEKADKPDTVEDKAKKPDLSIKADNDFVSKKSDSEPKSPETDISKESAVEFYSKEVASTRKPDSEISKPVIDSPEKPDSIKEEKPAKEEKIVKPSPKPEASKKPVEAKEAINEVEKKGDVVKKGEVEKKEIVEEKKVAEVKKEKKEKNNTEDMWGRGRKKK